MPFSEETLTRLKADAAEITGIARRKRALMPGGAGMQDVTVHYRVEIDGLVVVRLRHFIADSKSSHFPYVFVLHALDRMSAQSDTPPPPVREQMGKDYHTMPPEPRLQGVPGHLTDPQLDLRMKNEADTEANERAGWIDQNSGIAQIPVQDAMKIIAEKGFPEIAVPSAEKKKK